MAESSLEVTRPQTLSPPQHAEPPHTPGRPEEPITVALEAGAVSTLPAGREFLPQVEGYEILERLGHGGMGVVYRARHLRLNRLVALKMIRDGLLATEEQLARFYAEARAVAKLQHPHIVQIYEIGEQQGRPYFALELVEGGNLAQRLAVLPLPAQEAAQLVRTLARAMHHAHQQGIIHRDLKPANVLLTREGQPKITDFGLAKELEAEVFLTHSRSGLLMGTPSYMAPEQARGPSRQIGPAADIYGLGAILYEALTGHPPFVAHSLLEVLEQVRSQEPLLPSRRQSRCPRDLEIICLKCLRKEPGQRYATAGDLADDLDRHLRREPIQARPASVWERGLKWTRRHPAAVSLLAGVLLLAVVSSIVARYVSQQAEQVAQAKRDQDAARDEFRKSQYPMQLARAEQLVAAGDRAQARILLEECHPERRGWEWGHVRGLCAGRGLIERVAHNGGVSSLASHPTVPLLASGGQDSLVQLSDLRQSRNSTQFGVPPNMVASLAFAPDGDTLAVVVGPPAEQGVFPGPVNDKPPPRKDAAEAPDADGADGADGVADGRSWPHSLRPSADAITWFVAWKEEKPPDNPRVNPPINPPIKPQQAKLLRPAVIVWDLRTREPLFSLPEQSPPVVAAAFTPDGKYLATASGLFVSIPFPPPEREFLRPQVPIRPEKAAPDVRSRRDGLPWAVGRESYALVMEDIKAPPVQPAAQPPEPGRLTLWDARTGKEFGAVVLSSPALGLALHPREPILAAACEDGSVQLWDYKTSKIRSLLGHERRVRSIAFNGTGDILATGGQEGTVRLWDFVSGRERFVLREHSSDVLELAFSPDGERLASASADRTVKLWDPVRGQQLLTLRGHRGSVTSVVFSAKGRHLISGDTAGSLRFWESFLEEGEGQALPEPVVEREVIQEAPPRRIMEMVPAPPGEAIPPPQDKKGEERIDPPKEKARK